MATDQEKLTFMEAEREHVRKVQGYLSIVIEELNRRSSIHDDSKLVEPELSGFAEIFPKLKASTFGSDGYNALLEELAVTLGHHYAQNSHHPEHYSMWYCFLCKSHFTSTQAPESEVCEPNEKGERPRPCPKCNLGLAAEGMMDPASGIHGMNLFDLVEMFFDWWAATEKHADGNIMNSIEHQIGRFDLPPMLVNVLRNTVKTVLLMKVMKGEAHMGELVDFGFIEAPEISPEDVKKLYAAHGAAAIKELRQEGWRGELPEGVTEE